MLNPVTRPTMTSETSQMDEEKAVQCSINVRCAENTAASNQSLFPSCLQLVTQDTS